MAKRKRTARIDTVELELRLPRAVWEVYQAASVTTGFTVSDLICMSLAVALAAVRAGK